jgi:plasmid stabilization system protein ParE
VNHSLRLRPELVDDVAEAFHWYENAAIGLGHEFLRSYFAALAAVEREPRHYRCVYGQFRRILLVRFPYVLYFKAEADSVVVFLLIHGARNPKTIRRSLRRRNTKSRDS